MLDIAILGHGVVGSGVAEILREKQTKDLQEINLKKILDILDFEDVAYSELFTKNFEDILNDKEIKIVVETIGGLNPSFSYVKSLLENKKSVVTSNKELVCKKGKELLKIAKENGVSFLFEAAVGGGMPIILPLLKCFTANKIKKVEAILNGTTNFILFKMYEESLDFNSALKLAQSLGYAEKDPSDDLLGIDCKRKIAIICSLILKKDINHEKIHTTGLQNISSLDIALAKKEGYSIKLISKIDFLDDEQINIMVFPAFVSAKNKLFFVEGVLNGVLVKGNFVGDVFFSGAGAGKFPTATAVLADVVEIKNAELRNISPVLETKEDVCILDYKECLFKFYFRFKVKDLKKAKEFILKNYKSVNFILQDNEKEIAFKTDFMNQLELNSLEKEFLKNGIEQQAKFRILED